MSSEDDMHQAAERFERMMAANERRVAAHARQVARTQARHPALVTRYDAPCRRGATDCACMAHPVPEAGHGH